MTNFFQSPFKGKLLSEQVTNPNITFGRFSYYSGYYHGHAFDDCARFLLPDPDADKLIIGSFCSIGSGAAFPFHFMPEIPQFAAAANGYAPAGDTVIGSDVWIGSEAIIMPGITIGHGAVIGTRALVTRDVEPYTIVGGNPAKPIRKRFAEPDIAKLLEMTWWDWSLDALERAMPLLTGGS